MKPLLYLLFLTFGCMLLFSCQKEFSNPNGDTVTTDIDAQKFIDSSGITVDLQKTALTEFVIQLKDSGLWTKFMAIYPMIGGSEETIKWNLKDPRNSDAAYRLTIYGNPVYSPSGVLFPANTDYADTHFIDSMFAYNSNSIAYYSVTQNTVDGYDMGCIDTAPPYNEMSIYHSSDASDWFGYHGYGIIPMNTIGLFMFSATANDVKRYQDAVVIGSRGSAPVQLDTNKPILIGIVRGAISGGHRECALATIGMGLSDQDALTFYNIVQTFETELGR